MELLAPPIPGQSLLSLDEMVGREPSFMTSIMTGLMADCQRSPAGLGQEAWRMGAEPGPHSQPGRAPRPGGLEPSSPTAALFYCPLGWPPLSPLPLPLLPNSPVPYYPTLPLPSCPPQGKCSYLPRWQKYYPPHPFPRAPPTYCSVPVCSHAEGEWCCHSNADALEPRPHTTSSQPKEHRTSDLRKRSKFREGSKVTHKAISCRTRSFSQLDTAGWRAGGGGEAQAVADRALSEYSHIMETLGSRVTGRSEVVVEERGRFTEYLNQLCQQKEFVTQVLALIDMRCVCSLLSPDTDTHINQQAQRW
ncbi:uncharacterized protein LOC133135168 isoform X2 [Conger conger]|nr:uncharacterized protein LOC133135168 isoform X2 [Conger conger]